ncbi:cyclin-like protein [Chytridium lagenaria]|nr:cyclin-like protein [Chytridium lagenaria]
MSSGLPMLRTSSSHNLSPPSFTTTPNLPPTPSPEVRVPLFTPAIEIRRRYQEIGTSEDDDRNRRISHCNSIKRICKRMGFPHNTYSCALQLYHRYNTQHPKHGLDQMTHIRKDLNATCIFLACKIEETIKKARDIIQCLHLTFYNETLKDDSPIVHAQPLAVKFLKMMEGSKELGNKAWAIAEESYKTTLCVQYPAHEIAVAGAYLASRLLESTTFGPSKKKQFIAIINHYKQTVVNDHPDLPGLVKLLGDMRKPEIKRPCLSGVY